MKTSFSFFVLTLTLVAQTLSPVEARIAAAVEPLMPDAVTLLERIVNINSGTLNPAGVKEVGEVLKPQFEALGFKVRWIPMDAVGRGGHLVAERQGARGKKVLMIGHMDTVFEKESPFQRFERSGDKAVGPGVNDMKGGLVIMLGSLKALHGAGALDGTSITVFLTGDEERVGEPLETARRDLIAAAKQSNAALEYESGSRTDGREFATIGRRSSSGWSLKTSGTEAHSSGIFNPRVGSGAAYELARIIAAFHEQVQEPGLTFNVGILLSGAQVSYDAGRVSGSVTAKTNIIPLVGIAAGDLRALTDEQLRKAREKMRKIVAQHFPKTSAEITFEDKYPPMEVTEGNKALLRVLNTVNRDLNLEAMEALDPAKRGAGDISFVAPFVDGLSGLGAIGQGAHAPGETVDLTRLSIQTRRSALLIHRLTQAEVSK